jgi:hypothetical protein
MSETFYEPLIQMNISSKNLEDWKKKIKNSNFIPNHLLTKLDITPPKNDLETKKKLYIERIETFLKAGNAKMLSNLVRINQKNKELQDIKSEYDINMYKFNRSIQHFKDKQGVDVEVKLVVRSPLHKGIAYYHYLKYKKLANEFKDEKDIIASVDDFILKHKMYGLYVDDLLVGFMVIEKSRSFNIDGLPENEKVPTFYIQEIYIDNNYRKRDLAKIFIQYAIMICPTKTKYISLMTYDGNPIAKISQSYKFVLQSTPSGCHVNKLLLIREMKDDDFERTTNRISNSSS